MWQGISSRDQPARKSLLRQCYQAMEEKAPAALIEDDVAEPHLGQRTILNRNDIAGPEHGQHAGSGNLQLASTVLP